MKGLENSDHSLTLENFRRINSQLDSYLKELANLEFNFDVIELREFSKMLTLCNTELEKTSF